MTSERPKKNDENDPDPKEWKLAKEDRIKLSKDWLDGFQADRGIVIQWNDMRDWLVKKYPDQKFLFSESSFKKIYTHGGKGVAWTCFEKIAIELAECYSLDPKCTFAEIAQVGSPIPDEFKNTPILQHEPLQEDKRRSPPVLTWAIVCLLVFVATLASWQVFAAPSKTPGKFFETDHKPSVLKNVRLLETDAIAIAKRDSVTKWTVDELNRLAAGIDTIEKEDFEVRLGQIESYLNAVKQTENQTTLVTHGQLDAQMLNHLPPAGTSVYPRISQYLGLILMSTGDAAGAETEFQAALALPCDPVCKLELMYNLAVSYSDQGKIPKSIEYFDRVLTGLRNVADADHLLVCHALFGRAKANLKREQLPLAIKDMNAFFNHLATHPLNRAILPIELVGVVNGIWEQSRDSSHLPDAEKLREAMNKSLVNFATLAIEDSHELSIRQFLLAAIANLSDEFRAGDQHSANQLALAKQIIETPRWQSIVSDDIRQGFSMLFDRANENAEDPVQFYRSKVKMLGDAINNVNMNEMERSGYAIYAFELILMILEIENDGERNAGLNLQEHRSELFRFLDLVTTLPSNFETNVSRAKRRINDLLNQSIDDTEMHGLAAEVQNRLDSRKFEYKPTMENLGE